MRLYPQWEHLPDHKAWRDYFPKSYMERLALWRDTNVFHELKLGVFDGKHDAWSNFADLVDPRLASIPSAGVINVSFPPEALAFAKDYISRNRDRSSSEASMICSALESYARLRGATESNLFTLLPPEASDEVQRKFESELTTVERVFFGERNLLQTPSRRQYIDIDSVDRADIASVEAYVSECLRQAAEAG